MSRKVQIGEPHKLPPSPCESCAKGNNCPKWCDEWQAWVKSAWETVTGRSKRNGR